jgi:hypothetical protein
MASAFELTLMGFGIGSIIAILLISSMLLCCRDTLEDHEEPITAGDLFRKELHLDNDTPDEFRKYIIDRLSSSQAFRCKVVLALENLHFHYPITYANVMRQDKKKIR